MRWCRSLYKSILQIMRWDPLGADIRRCLRSTNSLQRVCLRHPFGSLRSGSTILLRSLRLPPPKLRNSLRPQRANLQRHSPLPNMDLLRKIKYDLLYFSNFSCPTLNPWQKLMRSDLVISRFNLQTSGSKQLRL